MITLLFGRVLGLGSTGLLVTDDVYICEVNQKINFHIVNK